MTDITGTPLDSGLIYQARLPFAWRAVQDLPEHADVLQQNAANEDLLRTFSLMEQNVMDYSDETGDYASELAHLDAKLNLALDLIGEVLTRQVAMPPPISLRLGARAVEWTEPAPPPLESRLIVTLYPHPKLPRALHFSARAIRIDEEGVVQAAFEAMSDSVRDWLEKMIFRHHRRSVALSRASRETPD